MRFILFVLMVFSAFQVFAQLPTDPAAQKWADSVYNSLSEEERIGQLIVARLSTMDMKTKKVTMLFDQTADYVKKYNIGSVCLFQGSPVLQAGYMNQLKTMAKTPILFSIDGEWGLGQRILDSVLPLPRQMMLGAVSDERILYRYGKVVAEQCKRMGIQQNYAPVLDVNNNPDNPVINDRSFGESKEKVATFGIQYMKGMQDHGVLACAKHFPGHGDVAVDSHLDLPVINKSMQQLNATELYPFQQAFAAGIGSVMIGHLYIPAIDSSKNRPTSLSAIAIENLLRKQIGYEGLTITDGLEMQGVRKYFPDGEASVQAILAGNDLLCVPDSIPLVVEKMKTAINEGRLSWDIIKNHVNRILLTKYQYVVPYNQPISTNHLTEELNKDVLAMRRTVAEQAITLLSKKDLDFFPLHKNENKGKLAYVAVGINKENAIARSMRQDYDAGIFCFDFTRKNVDSIRVLLDSIKLTYDKVVIGIHQINRAPANNFGISKDALSVIRSIQENKPSLLVVFGNAYAAKNWCDAKNLIVAYEDDSTVQHTFMDMLQGKLKYKGHLPVTVCEAYNYGSGIATSATSLTTDTIRRIGFKQTLVPKIDSIVRDGIFREAMPGCVVMICKKGRIILERGYGGYTYHATNTTNARSIYDLASLTKIFATTLAVMKLKEQGLLDVKKKLGQYLPEVRGTAKAELTLEQLLLHQGGLKPYIPFYKETIDSSGNPLDRCYAGLDSNCYATRVAHQLLLRNDIIDSFYRRIIESPTEPAEKYVYSDNDFIFLGKVVEQITGTTLDRYVTDYFYRPMGLTTVGYLPLERFSAEKIVPTTIEKGFRNQELRGDVHDQGAAIMGGVAGHAGLFSDAYDLSCLMQMLLDGGVWQGKQYLEKETIDDFTAYKSSVSRRGYGFDKPERDNDRRAEAYPAKTASARTFGHTGFTGTCAWADPEEELIFVFLSNRLYPEDNGVFKTLNIRTKLLETIYQSIEYPLP